MAEELSDDDDVVSQVLWRVARARVLARRATPAEAEALVRARPSS